MNLEESFRVIYEALDVLSQSNSVTENKQQIASNARLHLGNLASFIAEHKEPDKYKKYMLAGYIGDLWFLIRRLRDLKSILIEIVSVGELTGAQSQITAFIPKLEAKLKELEKKDRRQSLT